MAPSVDGVLMGALLKAGALQGVVEARVPGSRCLMKSVQSLLEPHHLSSPATANLGG
uniref:Uncharacterized protein n=1 Tax=Arundo donax TaxID=35708 RepID=A0A0A9AZX5_ARUDO